MVGMAISTAIPLTLEYPASARHTLGCVPTAAQRAVLDDLLRRYAAYGDDVADWMAADVEAAHAAGGEWAEPVREAVLGDIDDHRGLTLSQRRQAHLDKLAAGRAYDSEITTGRIAARRAAKADRAAREGWQARDYGDAPPGRPRHHDPATRTVLLAERTSVAERQVTKNKKGLLLPRGLTPPGVDPLILWSDPRHARLLQHRARSRGGQITTLRVGRPVSGRYEASYTIRYARQPVHWRLDPRRAARTANQERYGADLGISTRGRLYAVSAAGDQAYIYLPSPETADLLGRRGDAQRRRASHCGGDGLPCSYHPDGCTLGGPHPEWRRADAEYRRLDHRYSSRITAADRAVTLDVIHRFPRLTLEALRTAWMTQGAASAAAHHAALGRFGGGLATAAARAGLDWALLSPRDTSRMCWCGARQSGTHRKTYWRCRRCLSWHHRDITAATMIARAPVDGRPNDVPSGADPHGPLTVTYLVYRQGAVRVTPPAVVDRRGEWRLPPPPPEVDPHEG